MIARDPAILIQRLLAELQAAVSEANDQAATRAYQQLLAAHDAGHLSPTDRDRVDAMYAAWLSRRLLAVRPKVDARVRRARTYPVSEIQGEPLSERIIRDRR